MKIAIADDFIESVTPCIPIQWWMRYDVLPFLIIYSTLFSLSLSKSTFHIALFGIPSILLLHNLIFLLSQWSFSIKMKLGYSEVRNIEQAQFVFVKARKNMGKDKVEPLYRRNRRGQANIIIGGTKFDFNILFFQFQNIIYSYSVEDQSFKRELYPTSGRIGDFVEHKGHSNEDMLMNCLQKWGFNVFEIPIPLFLDLYIENLTAPFFVFQVLCLVLWSLDDYWYYSVLTLFMLMLFEGMMCRQRQNSLLMLREMRRPPITLYVFRGGQWLSGTSDELVPGDVISLATSGSATVKMKRDQRKAPVEDLVLPCDALIIKGSCVVNEAMLTGESVPQIKESLENADIGSDLTATIDVGFENNTDSSWRRHVVLGGTSLLQHAAASSEETMTDIDSSSLDMDHPVVKLTKNGLPLSPDRGCTAIVLRTGFATVQGGLMRKILFAKERVNVNEMETYRFIGVLVIFAAIASGVVLVQGLKDANRNNFKLILHCIMIITSVVPPELPMELSLAITNSLAALARGLVYCTEPFRLPYAGKLDVLCFDKTGTLTQDKMFLKGVVIASHMKAQDSETSLGQIFQDNGSLAPTTGPVVDMVIDPVSVTNASILVSTAMASCHSLILKDATNSASFVGDPLEIVTLEATGFQFDTATQATASHASSRLILPSFLSADKSVKLVLKHRYPFNSTLKRMSVLTEVTLKPEVYYYSSVTNSVTGLFLFTKGAPEVLAPMIADLPADYKTVYLYHMSRGKRVLALAGKKIASSLLSQSVGSEIHKKMTTMIKSREVMETKLTFLGFLIFDCDIKPDSKSVIRELKESNHKLVMITGDSPYTATDVALRLGMVAKDKPTVILQTLLNRQGILMI